MDHVDKANGYIDGVLSGEIPACKYVKLACKRHLKMITNPLYVFDRDAANAPCEFIELLPHTKGVWAQRRELIRLEPWQCLLLTATHGLLRASDGMRVIRDVTAVVPRKNGKTLPTAALGLFHLVGTGEHGAEVYCGASTERQSLEVFTPARLMALQSPDLLAHFGIQINARNISVPSKGSKFEPVVGCPGDGSSPSFAIRDECHQQSTAELRDAMVTGMGARQQPMLWNVSTAGTDIGCPFYDEVLSGRKVLEGTVENDQRFYIEYSLDDGDDWTTEESLRKANPNYGVSVFEDFLKAEQRNARQNANLQSRYLSKHCDIWCQSKSSYHNIQNWHACYDPNFKIENYYGREAIMSLDTAAKQDICAIQMLIPLDDGLFATFGRYFLPEDTIYSSDHANYLGWAHGSKIIQSDGNMNDFERIEQEIYDLRKLFKVTTVIYDDSHAAMLEQRLMSNGVPLLGFTMTAAAITEPMRMVDALINAKKFIHGDEPNAPASWMISNVTNKTRVRDDRDFPDKETPSAKIDAAVALYMAMAVHLRQPIKQKSIYERRGFLFV